MRVIDSHTEGEPTRVIIEGGPDLGTGPLSERLKLMADEFDYIRRSAILEPRGSDVLVGALLCPPTDPSCATGVIFFNNTGYLGMCGHGTIGVAVTLAHLGLIDQAEVSIETPVGAVTVEMHDSNHVSVKNVASYLYKENVAVRVPGIGKVIGDIAWGGNWFFLAHEITLPLNIKNKEMLTRHAINIKRALIANNITGEYGAEIDHIEFFANPDKDGANSKNFVLCPGDQYDRSPCGTGTSAKLAVLAAKGELKPREIWVQDSIIDSRFTASYEHNDKGEIIPTISGRAYIYGDTELYRHAEDPFKFGIG